MISEEYINKLRLLCIDTTLISRKAAKMRRKSSVDLMICFAALCDNCGFARYVLIFDRAGANSGEFKYVAYLHISMSAA